MKKSLIALLFLVVLVLSCGSFYLSFALQQLPSNDVYIVNPLNRAMKFSIVCDSGDKQATAKYELKPLAGDLYKCNGFKDTISLRLVTGRKKPVLVKLEPKKRYEFYWDSGKSKWSAREVSPRT
jgi:hypothetical protein